MRFLLEYCCSSMAFATQRKVLNFLLTSVIFSACLVKVFENCFFCYDKIRTVVKHRTTRLFPFYFCFKKIRWSNSSILFLF